LPEYQDGLSRFSAELVGSARILGCRRPEFAGSRALNNWRTAGSGSDEAAVSPARTDDTSHFKLSVGPRNGTRRQAEISG
jgi:hypothetical protein